MMINDSINLVLIKTKCFRLRVNIYKNGMCSQIIFYSEMVLRKTITSNSNTVWHHISLKFNFNHFVFLNNNFHLITTQYFL